MKTTQENINNMLNVVKYIFENYSEYEPALTGSLSLYLQGLELEEIHDIDIMFRKRVKSKTVMNNIISAIQNYTDIKVDIINGKLFYRYDWTSIDIEGTTIVIQTHDTIIEYLKDTYERSNKPEQYLALFQIYEEWLDSETT